MVNSLRSGSSLLFTLQRSLGCWLMCLYCVAVSQCRLSIHAPLRAYTCEKFQAWECGASPVPVRSCSGESLFCAGTGFGEMVQELFFGHRDQSMETKTFNLAHSGSLWSCFKDVGISSQQSVGEDQTNFGECWYYTEVCKRSSEIVMCQEKDLAI